MIFTKRSPLARTLILLLLPLALLGVLLGILYIRFGAVLDVSALVHLQPPIFVTKYKIVAIAYADKEEFLDKTRDQNLYLDVWSVGDNRAVVAATAPAVWRLRLAGLDVEVLYQSVDEYLKQHR